MNDILSRTDEFTPMVTSSESSLKSVSLDGPRRLALKHIEAFILRFSDAQAFAAAAVSSAPAALAQVTEKARIQEAGHLRCRFALSLFVLQKHLYFRDNYVLNLNEVIKR